jgi:hypothetical protein
MDLSIGQSGEALSDSPKNNQPNPDERAALVEPLEPRQMLSISISTVNGVADEQGQVHAQYAITRDGATSGASSGSGSLSAATVYFSIGYGTADGDDFVTTSSAVFFATQSTGTSTIYLDVVPADDSLSEPTETFTVSLTSCSGDSIGTSQASGTIADNDTPRVWVEKTQDGSEDSQTPAKFVFHRVGQLSSGQKAYFSLGGSATLGEADEDGNPIDGADYSGVTASTDSGETGNYEISFGGAESVTLTLTPFNDSVVEGAETIEVSICASPGNTMYADPAGNGGGLPAGATANVIDLQAMRSTDSAEPSHSALDALVSDLTNNDPDIRTNASNTLVSGLAEHPGIGPYLDQKYNDAVSINDTVIM